MVLNMKKSLLPILLLLILPVFSCSAFLSEKHIPEIPHCRCLPVFPDKDGWYGGDGAYSIQLDDKRTLWLFGDTFVSDEEGRNDRVGMEVILGTTLGISTCPENGEFDIQYYLKKKNGKFISSFGDETEWLWPQDPFMANGVLYIPLISISPIGTEALFNFTVKGHRFARIEDFSADDPHDWPVEYIDLTAAMPPGINAFAATSVIHENHVYFFPFYAHFGEERSALGNILARIRIDRLDHPIGAIEYFSNDGMWQNGLNPCNINIVLDACVSELSVRYHADANKWMAVYLSPADKGNQLLCQYADNLEGPWSEPKAFGVAITELDPQNPFYDEDTFCYAGKEHIEFSGDGYLIVTYVCNSAADSDAEAGFIRRTLSLYRPVVIQAPQCE